MLTVRKITIMNAASVFGRTVPNFLADKYGPFNGMFAGVTHDILY